MEYKNADYDLQRLLNTFRCIPESNLTKALEEQRRAPSIIALEIRKEEWDKILACYEAKRKFRLKGLGDELIMEYRKFLEDWKINEDKLV